MTRKLFLTGKVIGHEAGIQIAFLLLICAISIQGSFNHETVRYPDSLRHACEVKFTDIPEDILFGDYKVFMMYTRDSIMRELLSNEFVQYYNYLEVYNTPFQLNWDIPINLNYEEIVAVLTDNAGQGGKYNFLIKENNDFYVDTSYLVYRSSNTENGIKVFPDFKKLEADLSGNADLRFGVENNWNAALDLLIINSILSQQQIDAYRNWEQKIGLKRARRITKNSIIVPRNVKVNAKR